MVKNALSNFQMSAIVEPHVKLTLNRVSVEHMLVNKPPTRQLNCRVFNYDTKPKNTFRGVFVAVITPLSEGCGINHARTDSCSGSDSSEHPLQSKHSQQENCQQTVHAKTVHSTPQQNKNTHITVEPTLTSSENKDVFTLTDKINYLKSKNLLNDSQEIKPGYFHNL